MLGGAPIRVGRMVHLIGDLFLSIEIAAIFAKKRS
jgi:hypothetical protein